MKKFCLGLLIFTLCFALSASVEAKTKHKKKSIKNIPIANEVVISSAPLNNVKECEIAKKTFPLNYMEPQVLAEKLQLSFSSITVLCDNDTNSLSVTASSSAFKDITSFIAISDAKAEAIEVKIVLLELKKNYESSVSTNDNTGIFLTKSELSDIYNLDIVGAAKKIYESGSFITPYNSTTTISFKTNYSSEYSGDLEINLNPIIISTQNAQLSVSVALSAYSNAISTNSLTVSMIQLQRHTQNLILLNDVVTKETRQLAFSLPFMASINEIGQIFDKESVLSAESKIALIIQLREKHNE